jgi:hypothetical protein
MIPNAPTDLVTHESHDTEEITILARGQMARDTISGWEGRIGAGSSGVGAGSGRVAAVSGPAVNGSGGAS